MVSHGGSLFGFKSDIVFLPERNLKDTIENVIKSVPNRIVRLMPKRTASRPVTSGAITLATETEVVIMPSCAMLTWKALCRSPSSGVTAIHDSPKAA